jgi:hypothetical protein
VSVSLAAECLVVGPRRSGRDYDLLAASAGARPAVEDLSRIRRHNFEVRPFVRAERPVHAFFPLRATGQDVWLLATTSLNGETAGNPLWITTGLILTPDMLDAVEGRVLPLAVPWPGAEPPPPGSALAPFVVTPTPPAPVVLDPQVLAWAERLGRTRLAIEAPGETVAAVLAAVLDAAPIWRRRNLSFLSAPPEAAAPEDAPAFAVFETGTRVARDLPAYQLIQLDRPDLAVTATADAWDALLDAAAREQFGLSRGLDQAARALGSIAAETAEAGIQRRIEAYLDLQPDEADRFEALVHLVRAARTVSEPAGRGELVRALLRTFERRMKGSADPAAWLKGYLDRLEAEVGADGPRLLPARLAIETGVLFALPQPWIGRLAPAVVESLAEAAAARLPQAPWTTLASLEALLGAVVQRLQSWPGEPAAARLGALLAEAVWRTGEPGEGTLAAFVERVLAEGPSSALDHLAPALGRFKAGPDGARLAAALTRRLTLARRADFRDRRALASALAAWRAAKAWEAA